MMCATMMLAACSSDDSNADPKPGPSPEPEEKTIFYTATVGDDTRATVDSDNKTIKFAEGDKLYISSDTRTDLRGYLTLTSGAGTASASFSGKLYYTDDLPANDLSIKGTLVGADNESLTIENDKVTGSVNYGTGLVLPDGASTAVNEAVKKYGYLIGTSTFGEKTFNTLTQQTTFLNFTINVKKSGVNVNDAYTVTVANVGGYNRTGTVRITASGSDKVLKFAVPIAPQAIPNASLTIPDNNAIPFGRATALVAKVYNVSREVDDYVDLGLPSGTKWAKTNLGAATETDYGYYYAWGGTTGYSTDPSATDHSFSLANAPFYTTAYDKYNATDALTELVAADDAATQSRGTGWRMPTLADINELVSSANTTMEWKDNYQNSGISGYEIKSRQNSNTIFLPAASRKNGNTVEYQGEQGNYWSKTLYTSDKNAGYYIGFSKPAGSIYENPQAKGLSRYLGMTIRPVYKP